LRRLFFRRKRHQLERFRDALFAEIKGLDGPDGGPRPRGGRAIVDPAIRLMIDATHRYDGYVVQLTAWHLSRCSGPVAHEDHPQRALHAA